MDKNSLAHTTRNCKYHIVFEAKYHRQIIHGKIRVGIAHWFARMRAELCLGGELGD